VTVRTATFAYPWDLGRLGVERALEEIAADGFDAVYLAATYHPIDALSPRDGRVRLYSSGRGAVHFPAREGRYGRIRPAVSSPDVTSVWPEAERFARSVGLTVIPWTIVLYQPWIVDRYPDCARVLPGGDPIDAGVCPAHDDVREYVAALCDDLVDQFGSTTLHLEGPAPASYDYGWLRPRILVTVPKMARELLALCFCASCLRRGTDSGLDVGRVQQRVNDAIAASLATGTVGSSGEEELAGDAELVAFAELSARASIELVDAVAARVQSSGGPRLSGMPWTPYSSVLGARDDEVFAASLRPFDQVMVAPRPDDSRTKAAVASRATRGLELAVLLTPNNLDEGLRGAGAIGASEIAVYNYGLLREVDTRRMGAMARAALG
jgi:hypothetical protein